MNALKIVLIVAQCISAVALTVVVLFQSGKSNGLSSAIAGSGESFMSKGNTTTLDAKLSKATKWIAVVFVLLCLALDLLLVK